MPWLAATLEATPTPLPVVFDLGHWQLWLVQLILWLSILLFICCLVIAPLFCVSEQRRTCLRHLGFMLLHLMDYVTNVVAMVILGTDVMLRQFLFVLLPVHILVGCFCAYAAATNESTRLWQCPAVLRWPFVVIVLGLMQGVQLLLSWQSYKASLVARTLEEDMEMELGPPQIGDADLISGERTPQIPALMPARFHCKAMDGLLEGTVFAYVILLVLTDSPRSSAWAIHLHTDKEDIPMSPSEWMRQQALYVSLLFSTLAIGFALMDLDYRTSVVIQRMLNGSVFRTIRHLAFRIAEVMMRIMSSIVLCFCIRLLCGWWWAGYVLIAMDYFAGVCLLLFIAWHDPVRKASFIVGLPLLVANVVQFTDVPVLAYQARRLSRILVPFRSLQLVFVLILCAVLSSNQDVHDETPFAWVWHRHAGTIVLLAMCFVIYYVLLISWAIKAKPVADLYSAVADGDTESLGALLQRGGLVLDVNRCGPDGRTPVHVAILQGHAECLRLLIEGHANLDAKTADGRRNNVVHLAAAQRNMRALRLLCQECGTGSLVSLANTANTKGDTPLHVAARKHNLEAVREMLALPGIDTHVRNNEGLRPCDSVMSYKFHFDYRSTEQAITMLFQHAEVALSSNSNVNAAYLPHDTSVETGILNSVQDSGSVHENSPAHENQQLVPLRSVSRLDEEAFLQKYISRSSGSSALDSTESLACDPGPHFGVSSFMLSAGLGALSRVFLSMIQEEDCTDGSLIEADGDPSLDIPVSIIDFNVIKSIGKGSFGRVDLAEHKGTKELYAMKVLERQKYMAQRITRFAFSEQYILKTTRHPFIVSLHFAFQTTRHWVMVMEYCPRGNLMERLVAEGEPGLTPAFCARSSGEILLALEFMHRIRVIFRDVKPDNIVFDAAGRSKVTDFGLAKKLGHAEQDAATACGTEGYAAPELVAHTGRYTYAIDMYSLGILLYVILSGGSKTTRDPKKRLPPHTHESLRAKLQSLRTLTPPWAMESVGALALVIDLTRGQATARPTATEAKEHRFFTDHLGHPVDELLPGPCSTTDFRAPSSSTST